LPITTASFIDGNIEDESDLDETLNVFPLDDADLVALEGRCVCAVVYDGDVSIDEDVDDQGDYDGVTANLQGATLGLTAFNVTGTLAPGSIPESQSSSSLRDVVVELIDPTIVPEVCGEVRLDRMVTGRLSMLRATGGDFSQATQACVREPIGPMYDYLDTPPPGEVFWIVTRRVSPDGTYDSGGPAQVETRDDEIASSGFDCSQYE